MLPLLQSPQHPHFLGALPSHSLRIKGEKQATMTSLEELLAKEGFKTGKLKQKQSSSLPSYSPRSPIDPSEHRSRRNRSKSDAFSRRSHFMLSSSRSGRDRGEDLRRSVLQRSKESPKIRAFDNESYSGSREIAEEFEERCSGKDRGEDLRRSVFQWYKKLPEIRVFDNESCSRSREIEEEFEERYHVSHPDSVDEDASQKDENSYSERFQKSDSYKTSRELYEKEKLEKDDHHVEISSAAEPKLDEIAVKALISILTGYLRRFFKDENFRVSFYQNCSSCLGITDHNEGGAISNLRQAIRVVERTTAGDPSSRELKRAALQLSVITGLGSTQLRDGCTCGIPNLYLSSCAHLYLGLICKFQKKDKASAEHLLEVFCDCPYEARNTLLAGLWDRLFSPHFSQLKEWYDNEARLISRTKGREQKMKLLGEAYNNMLDVGTHQFGVYYKEWLMEDVEGPEIPCIVSPTSSFKGLSVRVSSPIDSDEFLGPGSSKSSSRSSQAMVSRSLYGSVFGQSSKKSEMDEGTKDTEEETNASKFCSGDGIPVSDIFDADDERTSNGYTISSINNLSKVKVVKMGSKDPRTSPAIAKENELTMKKLAEAAFHPQVTDQHKKSQLSNGSYENLGQESFFSSIPKDFVCPITGQLFQDPVTIESGITYERAAIKDWLDRGNKACPVTKRTLERVALPATNFVLKRVIDGWKSAHCRNLFFSATKIEGNTRNHEHKLKDEPALFIIEQLFTSFSVEEQMENVRYLISLGGLQLLLRRLELGDLDEKTRVSSLLLCCIKANGFCRHYLAANIGKSCIIDLLHSKQVAARANAVSLLIELICLNRRTAIDSFISSLQTEDTVKTMHVLLIYLQSVQPEERVMVAVLLLHFDLMVEPTRYSLYREEAVDSITLALDLCLSDAKFIPNSRKALLMLGGHFSSSGEMLTETWLLRQAGFYDNSGSNPTPDDVEADEIMLEEENDEEEAKEKEEWLKSMALVLLSSGKRSFLDTISECLGSENMELVRVCLAAVAWLTHALAALPLSELQLSAFLALVPRLREILESGIQIEHRVLVSLSLLNFSKISGCRVLLMAVAEEMHGPLQNLAEVNLTSKKLFDAIFGEHQELAGNGDSYYLS